VNARVIEPRAGMVLTAFTALFFTILPLPPWADVLRPPFLMLAVLYWSIAAPRAGGILLGFLAGLALDVFNGAVLGQHALAFCVVTYIAVREHQKIRAKPVFQQSLIVFGALLLYEFSVFAIDGWTSTSNAAPAGGLRWVHTVTGAMVWPVANALLGRSHSPR
jgi:rod shape-determining protein MreD